MSDSVGRFVTDVAAIGYDHEARQSHAHAQSGELITGHPDPSIFHQHDSLHTAQPGSAAEAYARSLVRDRPRDKIRILEKAEINFFEPAIRQERNKLYSGLFQTVDNLMHHAVLHRFFPSFVFQDP